MKGSASRRQPDTLQPGPGPCHQGSERSRARARCPTRRRRPPSPLSRGAPARRRWRRAPAPPGRRTAPAALMRGFSPGSSWTRRSGGLPPVQEGQHQTIDDVVDQADQPGVWTSPTAAGIARVTGIARTLRSHPLLSAAGGTRGAGSLRFGPFLPAARSTRGYRACSEVPPSGHRGCKE